MAAHADDAAILERPSRFDRKYHFGLPGPAERLAYLTLWNLSANPEARMDEPALQALADATDGFSYAYLKELMVSALVRWLSYARATPLSEVADGQVRALRDQMTSVTDPLETRQAYVEEWQPGMRRR